LSDLTFVIPIGPYHTEIAKEAIASASNQTVGCQIVHIYDTEGKGAGWARNKGLSEVDTSHISFLDADDVIDPRFAEICLGVLEQYSQSHDDPRYVYTDWIGAQNVAHQSPEPCEAWTNNTSHLVTTVLPTERVRLIGGFDEVMQIEDADFYVRLRLSGVCGIHVNAPLVSYREGGQRSITARASGEETKSKLYMTQRYGGYNMGGCCGDPTPGPTGPTNEPMEGDVLAQAQWSGNRQERGRITGRLYPRTSFPKMLYVAEGDVQAAPMHWKRVNSPMQAANGVILQPQYKAGDVPWQDTVNALFGGGNAPSAPSQPIEYKPNTPGLSKAAVLAKAQGK
jgi:hypothetical protein